MTTPSVITLNWKVTTLEAVVVLFVVAAASRLLAGVSKSIGGKYSDLVHAAFVGVIAAGIYVGMLYAYRPLSDAIASEDFARSYMMYTHGYTQSQCARCPSSVPPKPEPQSNFAALPPPPDGNEVCYIGAYSQGVNLCATGECA